MVGSPGVEPGSSAYRAPALTVELTALDSLDLVTLMRRRFGEAEWRVIMDPLKALVMTSISRLC